MGYLLHLLVALLGQGLAEAGWTTGWVHPWALLPLALVPHALAWSAHRLFLRGRFRASAALVRALSGAGPALHVLAACAFGWMDSLHAWLGEGTSLTAWPRASLLLALAPFLVYELAAIDARARIATKSASERRAWRGFQTRMLLSGIVPLAGYVLICAAVGASEVARVQIEEVSLFAAAFACALLVLLALLLPSLLRNVWDTSPFPPGPLRDLLQAVADRARFRSSALLAWNTGDMMANAAIVGVGPRTRVVLFSDSLLAQLDGPELAAVFAHEIGHAARRHVLVFVTWAAAFFLLADLAANHFLPATPWFSGGFVLVAVAVWVVVFGFASRRFELEADLFCLDLLGDASALIRALEKVGGRFRDVASWRHFSTADRVRFLEGAALDPGVGKRLSRGLRRWTRAGVALLLVAGALESWTLARAYPEDRLRADLRLGRYVSANVRAAAIGGVDPRLVALASRGASLQSDRVSVPELEEEARVALSRADLPAALAWLDLGGLRGSADLDAVAGAIRTLVEKGDDPQSTLDAKLFEAWRGELEVVRGLSPDAARRAAQ
jgi:Zn-dependent protease with chaperone function